MTGQGESGPAIRLSFLDDLCAFSCSMAYLLQSPIQTPVLYGLGDVGGLDLFGSLEVGDGAADFEDAAVGAGAQTQFVDRHLEQLFSPFFDHAEALDIFCSHLGVGMDAPLFKALGDVQPHSFWGSVKKPKGHGCMWLTVNPFG